MRAKVQEACIYERSTMTFWYRLKVALADGFKIRQNAKRAWVHALTYFLRRNFMLFNRFYAFGYRFSRFTPETGIRNLKLKPLENPSCVTEQTHSQAT
jgi:hypothetical protein